MGINRIRNISIVAAPLVITWGFYRVQGYLTNLIKTPADSDGNYLQVFSLSNYMPMMQDLNNLVQGKALVTALHSGVNLTTNDRGIKVNSSNRYSGRITYNTTNNRLQVSNSLNVSEYYAKWGAGLTAERPTGNLFPGDMFYDKTLGKPIWWTGAAWVDAAGLGV